MTLDFTRVAGLLARLPFELQPTGALQIMNLAEPFEPKYFNGTGIFELR